MPVDAAKRLESLDSGLARETHLEALGAAMWVSGVDNRPAVLDAAEAARAAPSGPKPPRLGAVLLDATALRLTEGYAAAAPTLSRALEGFHRLKTGTDEGGRWLWLTGPMSPSMVALEVWDDEAWRTLATHQVRFARDTGALVQLQFAVNFLAGAHVSAGEFAAAAALIDEDRLIAEASGTRRSPIPRRSWRHGAAGRPRRPR